MWYSAVGSIVTLCLSLLIAPLTAAAQSPGTVYRIGVLSTESPLAHLWEALLDGLRERGYSEGQNLVFERRFSQGQAERFPELAAELAAKHATQTIPIVHPVANDPLGAGLVASLARPGGNLTGLRAFASDLSGKRLE